MQQWGKKGRRISGRSEVLGGSERWRRSLIRWPPLDLILVQKLFDRSRRQTGSLAKG